MVTLRCTRSLLKRLHAVPATDAQPSTVGLGDWYGVDFQVGRRRFALFVDGHARLPIVLTAQELKHLPAVLAERLALVLAACGVEAQAAAAECARMSEVTFATTNSRSVLGTMNDFVFGARHSLELDPQLSLVDLSLDLSETPMMGPCKGACPADLAVERLGAGTAAPQGDTRALVVLNVGVRTAICRPLGGGGIVSVRLRHVWSVVPGQIIEVQPTLQWTEHDHECLAGPITSMRIDVAALSLEPLRLTTNGMWDPHADYWIDFEETVPDWARAAIAWGPRPDVEMQQILPGADPDDPFSDPVCRANDLKDAGHFWPAYQTLMGLCAADLRCLDAHAHLGNLMWDMGAERALPHYEVGVRLGEQALGQHFDGVLLWGMLNNRPFLRCLYGFGLSVWRLGRFEEAAAAFERLLWLDPPDNQGARFVLDDVRQRKPWTPED
jgi:hypothetical protein